MAYNCENFDADIKFWENSIKDAIANPTKYSYSIEELKTSADKKIKELKLQKANCSKDPLASKCPELKARIDGLISTIANEEKLALNDNRRYDSLKQLKQYLTDAKLEYQMNGCDAKLLDMKFTDTKNVISEYTDINQARIDAETTYQKNKKTFLGVMILLVGLYVIAIRKN